MSALALSRAASALLRILIARSGAHREQVLITAVTSTDWRSLTFNGERHRIALHLVAPHAAAHAARMIHRIEDCEFSIPSLLVADITVAEGPTESRDSSVTVTIDALTIDDC